VVHLGTAFDTLLAGLRLSVNAALFITIAVELVDASQGLGALIWFAWQILRTTDLYVGLIAIAAIGIVSNVALIWLRNALVPWSTID
jgi:NitT/TauT family transport system permease protein